MVWKYAATIVFGSFLQWVGTSVWEKHGAAVANPFPITEKLGLAEPPPDIRVVSSDWSISKRNRISPERGK